MADHRSAIDRSGNIYGTVPSPGSGNVYQLLPSSGSWIWNLLYKFPAGQNGASPEAGVTLDSAGNVYGTTVWGGKSGFGTIYELSPAGGGWTEQVLYSFSGYGEDGGIPQSDLIRDVAGNLYGTTPSYINGGTVFELSPSGGEWVFKTLYQFPQSDGSKCTLAMDSAGNLFGTTMGGGPGTDDPYGSVFKLTPSGNGWTYSTLYKFTGQTDGWGPTSAVLDSMGNIFGTTVAGGTGDPNKCYGSCGVIFEITP